MHNLFTGLKLVNHDTGTNVTTKNVVADTDTIQQTSVIIYWPQIDRSKSYGGGRRR